MKYFSTSAGGTQAWNKWHPEPGLNCECVCDYLDQLQALKKRMSQIQTLDPQELVLDNIEDKIEDKDGSSTTASFSVPQ